ncbi:MAG: Clp protease ClpP [Oscillibacter sp.]|nr:Clp protease ClpP [Oscillibacter sp.]
MAILKIYNPIISDEERLDLLWFCGIDGVSFSSVDEFIQSVAAEDDTIDLRIHCPGGDVTEGWAIVDKLRATGKTIVATVEGQCASMATIILCAASVRRAAPHASLLIHDPYIPEYTLAGAYHAEDLERIANDLKVEREKMLAFYVERTGTDRDVLDAQMNAGTYFGPEKAKELGFIHEITPPKSAAAEKIDRALSPEEWNAHNPKNQITMSKETKKSAIAQAFAALGKALGLGETKVVAYDLNTADGGTITIEKEEGEDPAVGDKASPDGEHKMPDGKTIVIEEGVITEIRDADDNSGDDNDDNDGDDDETAKALEQANARIAELEAELATAKAAAKTPEDLEILNLVTVAGGIKWLKSAKSNYKPAAGNKEPGKKGSDTTPVKKSLVAQRLEALEKKNKGEEE